MAWRLRPPRPGWMSWWGWPWPWTGSLKGTTLLYGVSVLGERAVGLIMLALLTRVLSPETYGLWTQMVAAASTVSTVLLLGFNATLVSLLAGTRSRLEASGLFHGMLLAVSALALVSVGVASLFADSVSALVFGAREFAAFAGLLGFLVLSDTLFELTAMVLRARQRIPLASVYYLLKTVLRLGVFILVLVVWPLQFRDAVWGIVLVQGGLVALIYGTKILGDLGLNLGIRALPWRHILALSLPFVPYYAVVAFNGFVARFFLAQFAGLTEVAIFSVAYSLLAVVGIIYSVMAFTLYPHLAALWARGDRAAVAESLRKFTVYYLFFGAPCIALLSLLGRPLISLLSTEAYVSGWPLLVTVGLGILVFGIYQLHIYIPILAGRTLANLTLMTGAFVVNVIMSRLLVPAWGVLGAAAASLGSSLILAAGTVLIGQRHVPYHFPWIAGGRIATTSVVMAAVAVISLRWRGSGNLVWVILIAVGSLAVYVLMDLAQGRSFIRELR